MPTSSSSHSPHSSSHHKKHHHSSSSSSSSKARPVTKSINATSQLSASALLAASAQASDELERILRGDRSAKHRSRSRSRTKSPHKAALAEAAGEVEDPFLVHTVGSSSSSVYNRERKQKEKHDPIASLLGTTSGLSISSSKKHHHSSSNSHHRSSRSRSSKHAHRSKSRSLSRTREADRLAASSSSAALPLSHSHHSHSHHSSASHHHHHHHSSQPHEHGSRSRSRTRSRSHSRNRYPDGLAPPLQSVGGGVDAELRGRFHDRFEHDYYEERGSPPMSPGRLHERAAYERELLLREEEAYLRSRGGLPYEPYAEDVRRYDPYPRRDYAFDGTGRYAPQDPPEENPFDLETDAPKFEPAVVGDGKPTVGTVLTCGLCQKRYEDLSSANAGKVPRYLLCGHTWCTSCLQSELEKQQNLNLANDSGLPAAGTTITSLSKPLGVTINLPCPLGTCAPTPVHEHGVLDLPVNKSFLDASRFLRSRRAAGHGLKDTGIGRGDERGEAERLAELNKELEEDAKVQQNIAGSMVLGTSLPCQQCSVHIASLYCQSCNIRFCPSCSASVHIGRALAEHVKRGLVLPINVARARGLLFQANGGTAAPGAMTTVAAGLLCPTHADQPLSLYCRTCQIPVCRDCITPLFKGQHLPPGHDVDLLTTVLASAQTELKHGVSAVEGTIAKLEKYIRKAADQINVVSHRATEVRTELHESFNSIRAAVLKSLDEREKALEAELMVKCSQKESRVHAHRAELAKLLTVARGAHEEGVRVLGSADEDKTDIFAIRALLDVRAAINAGANAPSLLLDAPTLNQHDVLLRMRPRELIRLVESQISKAGGVIASIPAEPSWVAFASSGTSLVLSWAPAAPPVEGEVLEYTLEVCELPRGWRSKLRVLQPSLFPNPPSPDEDSEEEMKWDGAGPLGDRSRAAVNWLSVPPGNVAVGGAEQIWKVAGGAGWAGPFTTLYSGEVTSVKHDNLNLLSAYIYRLSVKNDLGSSAQIYSLPSTLPCMHLSYASDMDSNGLITYLGSNGGTTPWSNPTVNNLLDITASSIQIGETTALTSRQASTFQTLDRHLSWIRIDVARGQPFRMLLSHYTLANCGRGVGVRRVLRNWALQGSLNGVDWVTLREHVKDQTLAPIPLATASWSVNQPTPQPYRYIRILQTDVNQAGDHHLALGQIELYGWLVRD